MELISANFGYKPREKKFEFISYTFNPLDFSIEGLSQEEIQSKANMPFRHLENMIEKEFGNLNLKKEVESEITDDYVTIKQIYSGNSKQLITTSEPVINRSFLDKILGSKINPLSKEKYLEGEFIYNTLEYTITTYDYKKNTAKINMRISDSNDSLKNLNILESVISMPDLTLTSEAKKTLDKISHLKNEDFDFQNYIAKFPIKYN